VLWHPPLLLCAWCCCNKITCLKVEPCKIGSLQDILLLHISYLKLEIVESYNFVGTYKILLQVFVVLCWVWKRKQIMSYLLTFWLGFLKPLSRPVKAFFLQCPTWPISSSKLFSISVPQNESGMLVMILFVECLLLHHTS